MQNSGCWQTAVSWNGEHEHLSCQLAPAHTEDALRAGTEGLSYFGKDLFVCLFILSLQNVFSTLLTREKNKQVALLKSILENRNIKQTVLTNGKPCLPKTAEMSVLYQKSHKRLKTSFYLFIYLFPEIMNSKGRIIGKEIQALFSFWHFRKELKTFLHSPHPLSWWSEEV